MKYRIFILGCGAVGRVLSYHLMKNRFVNEILIGDVYGDKCINYIKWLKNDKLSFTEVDAGRIESIVKAGKGFDIIVNAVTPEYNLNILKAALEIEADYIDLAFGPPYENLEKEMEFNDDFELEGLTAITGSGVAPGLTNIMASIAADELDHIKSIRVRIYGELRSKKYISTWSPKTFIQDCLLEPIIVENGRLVRKEAFSGEEIYEFPYFGGKRVWLHAHEEPLMFYQVYRKYGLEYSDVKMGNLESIKLLYDMGLLSSNYREIDGIKKRIWEYVADLLPKPPSLEELKEMMKDGVIEDSRGIILVDIIGDRDGEIRKYLLWIFDPGIRNIIKTYPMATNVSFLAAINAAVLIEMMIEDRISERGVLIPDMLNMNEKKEYVNRLKNIKPPLKIYRRVEYVI